MIFNKKNFYLIAFAFFDTSFASKLILPDQIDLSKNSSVKFYSELRPLDLLNKIKNGKPSRSIHASHSDFVYQPMHFIDPSCKENLQNIVIHMQNAARYDFPKHQHEMSSPYNPAETIKDINARQFTLDTFNFMTSVIEDPMKLDFLRQIFPQGYITPEEWSLAGETLQKINAHEHIAYYHEEMPVYHTKQHTIPDYFKSPEFFQSLKETANQIDQIAEPGDTIIGVGNTPQYVIRALQLKTQKKFNLISVALSGWPGRPKTSQFLNNIITEQGLENYQTYLQSLTLDGTTQHQRFWFLDIVNGGGGIEFLAHQLHQAYQKQGQSCPEMNVIALNDIGDQFRGQTLSLNAISLNQTILARNLDRMPPNIRITPDFPAWRWHYAETINPSELKTRLSLQDIVATSGSGEYAQELQDLMAHHLNHKSLTGYNWHLSSESVPEGIAVDIWKGRLNFYQSKSYELRKFFNSHFDLIDLYGDQNNQNFYNWIHQFSPNDTFYQENVENWKYFKESYKRANNPVWHQTNDANTLGLLMHLEWSHRNGF